MKRRTLAILGGAAAVAVGGAILLTPDGTEAPPPSQAVLAFPNLAARLPSVARLEVLKHDSALVVVRSGDNWVLPSKADYPVRPERVRELLTGLTELRLVEQRTANPEMLERLGLEDPARPGATSQHLRLLDANGGVVAELILGRRRVRTQGNLPEAIYVRRVGENQSWLAEGRISADADPQLWLDRDVVNLPRERVRRVTIRREGEPELVLTRPGEADAQLAITTPAEAPAVDETSIDEVGRGFEFLTFLDVRREAEVPGESLGEGHFELTDNLAIRVRVHKQGEAVWVILVAEGDAEAARLNARWRGWAFQVGPWKEKAFVPRIADLVRQEEPAPETPEPPAEEPASPPAPAATSPPVAPAPTATPAPEVPARP